MLFGAPATLGLAFAMLERSRAAILGLLCAATCGAALSSAQRVSRAPGYLRA